MQAWFREPSIRLCRPGRIRYYGCGGKRSALGGKQHGSLFHRAQATAEHIDPLDSESMSQIFAALRTASLYPADSGQALA